MPQVFIMNGPEKGRSIPFEASTVSLGRGTENTIQVRDKSISRKHLRIEMRGEKCFITDMGSKNGTFIDGIRMKPETEYEVQEGMPIAVGKTFMSIGKPYPKEVLAVLDSIDLFKELDEAGEVVKDRPLTARRNMELIYKVSNLLVQSQDVKELLEKVLTYIMEVLQRIDRGVAILSERESRKISEVISIPKSNKEGETKPFSTSIVDRVLREGNPISMVDTGSEEESNLSESIHSMEIRSVMCVPLKSKSGLMGAIYVDSLKKPHGFRKEDLDLLVALSSPAALAIENALVNSTQQNSV
jgi:pSer/pThr/pTyr-binding forkhead associated (FHA) protein